MERLSLPAGPFLELARLPLLTMLNSCAPGVGVVVNDQSVAALFVSVASGMRASVPSTVFESVTSTGSTAMPPCGLNGWRIGVITFSL